MGRTYDALLRAEQQRAGRIQTRLQPTQVAATLPRPRCTTIAIASPKGGVGKTTLALHLAVYLRALREDLPLLVWNLDEQDTLERGLLTDLEVAGGELAFRRGLRAATRTGEFGIDVIPSPNSGRDLEAAITTPGAVTRLLAEAGQQGIAILDTGSRLDAAANVALEAADLVLVPVRDPVSLREGGRVWEQVRAAGSRAEVRAVLFGIDLRVKLTGTAPDVLALLLAQLRHADQNHFATFISRSPAVEALSCGPDGRLRTVLHAAPRSIVHRQMAALSEEILEVAEPILSQRQNQPAPSRLASIEPAPVEPPAPAPMAKVPASPPAARGFLQSVFRRAGS